MPACTVRYKIHCILHNIEIIQKCCLNCRILSWRLESSEEDCNLFKKTHLPTKTTKCEWCTKTIIHPSTVAGYYMQIEHVDTAFELPLISQQVGTRFQQCDIIGTCMCTWMYCQNTESSLLNALWIDVSVVTFANTVTLQDFCQISASLMRAMKCVSVKAKLR